MASSSIVPDTYYTRTASRVSQYPALTGAVEADVCIIGGGLAGLNTALGLIERGMNPVVLESHVVGFGASGRNGGFVLRGFDAGEFNLPGLPLAQRMRLMKSGTDAQKLIRKRIKDFGIDCQVVDGSLAVTWGRDVKSLQADVEESNRLFDFGLEFWSRAQVREHCKTDLYHGGVFSRDDFHFHPLRYTQGIAAAVTAKGGRIYELTKATAPKKSGTDWIVATPQGSVRARHVVVCTSAYGPGFDRRLDLVTFPVQTYVMVTKPLDPDDLAQTINTPFCVYDLRFACDYYRVLPDRRIMWGGRAGINKQPDDISRLMLEDMFRVYPKLRGRVEADISWDGLQSYTPYRMPVLGQRADGYWYNTAFAGHGMAPTTIGGEIIAAAIADGQQGYRDYTRYMNMFTGGPLGPYVAMGLYNIWRLWDWWRFRA